MSDGATSLVSNQAASFNLSAFFPPSVGVIAWRPAWNTSANLNVVCFFDG